MHRIPNKQWSGVAAMAVILLAGLSTTVTAEDGSEPPSVVSEAFETAAPILPPEAFLVGVADVSVGRGLDPVVRLFSEACPDPPCDDADAAENTALARSLGARMTKLWKNAVGFEPSGAEWTVMAIGPRRWTVVVGGVVDFDGTATRKTWDDETTVWKLGASTLPSGPYWGVPLGEFEGIDNQAGVALFNTDAAARAALQRARTDNPSPKTRKALQKHVGRHGDAAAVGISRIPPKSRVAELLEQSERPILGTGTSVVAVGRDGTLEGQTKGADGDARPPEDRGEGWLRRLVERAIEATSRIELDQFIAINRMREKDGQDRLEGADWAGGGDPLTSQIPRALAGTLAERLQGPGATATFLETVARRFADGPPPVDVGAALLAPSVPALFNDFARRAHQAALDRAKTRLERLGRAMGVRAAPVDPADNSEQAGNAADDAPCELPDAAPPTRPIDACCSSEKSVRRFGITYCSTPSKAWKQAPWSELGFSVDQPHPFSYRIETEVPGKSDAVNVIAERPFSCSSEDTFSVVMTVAKRPDSPGCSMQIHTRR